VRDRHHRFASARLEILLASSTGSAADDEASSAPRSCAIEIDLRSDASSRSLATSIRYGIDNSIRGHTPSGTAAHGHCAIAAPSSIMSPTLHRSIGPDHLRPDGPARQPRRLTDRQLTPAA
jgi:hypothetical protein